MPATTTPGTAARRRAPQPARPGITEQQLNEMGFETKLRVVTRDTMIARFCTVPESEVHVCPSVGWSQDFADPAERAQAWADVNHDVMAEAPSIPYMWDHQSSVVSPDVRGVQNGFTQTWDLSFTSLR